jgi:hypothetical protein
VNAEGAEGRVEEGTEEEKRWNHERHEIHEQCNSQAES